MSPIDKSAETLIHALFTSRVDSCNGLYAGLPLASTNMLQRVQNAAARLLTGTGRHEHIIEALVHPHWLPIPYHVQYKDLLFSVQIIAWTSPAVPSGPPLLS